MNSRKSFAAAAVAVFVVTGGLGAGVVTNAYAQPSRPDATVTNPELDFQPTPAQLAALGSNAGGANTSPANVRTAQHRLLQAGYWHLGVDGVFGQTTQQAVYAFQKERGLDRTGVLDAPTSAALANAQRPLRGTMLNNGMEIDKGRQVIKVVRDRKVIWVFNTSTGSGQRYDEPGGKGVAITRNGTHKVNRVVDEMEHGPLGDLYRPRYFDGGIAVHGSTSIPPYPASHGCVRVSNAAINFIWDHKLAPMGSYVVVHD